MDLINFFIRNRSEVLELTLQHLFLVAVATGAAALAGIPIGILLTRRPALSKPVLAIANILQTIPSLALFGFLIPVLGSYGIGKLPAIIALFLYSLLPIIRTFVLRAKRKLSKVAPLSSAWSDSNVFSNPPF